MKSNLEVLMGSMLGGSDRDIAEKALKRLYKYVGTDCVEELSFNFEDNLFLVFYKLAQIENYRNINDDVKLISAEAYFRKIGIKRAPRNLYDGESLKIETMDLDEARAANIFDARLYKKSERALSEKQSMVSIKKIIEQYQGNWAQFLTGENIDRRQLLSDIKYRIKTAFTPTYERAVEKPNYIEYTAELFDMALEMAVCAYVAHKESSSDLAWVALSKAREFLGLYVGVRLNVELNLKKDLARAKKIHTSRLKQENSIGLLTKQLVSLRNKGWRTRAENPQDFTNRLITELLPILKSNDFRGFRFDGGELSVKDVEEATYQKIQNLLDTHDGLKNLSKELCSLSLREKNLDDKQYFCIEKKEYEKIQIEIDRLKFGDCSNESECPKYIQQKELMERAERLIKDPLFQI